MYDPNKDLRLARANTPIRNELGAKGKVWFYVKSDDVDRLAADHPTDYLAILATWREALYNQCFYHFDCFGSVHVACPVTDGSRIAVLELVGAPEGEFIRLMNADYCTTQAEWISVKTQTRRIGKRRM